MYIKKAIANYLINDSDINPIIGDRVYRNKATITDNTPFIVYSFWKTTNKMWWWNNVHHYIWYNVVFDIVWKYEEQENMETVRQKLIEKLNWYSWDLTTDWSWTVWLKDEVDLYDDKTDLLVYRVEFIFKEII